MNIFDKLFKKNEEAIKIMYENISTIGEQRHIVSKNVINRFSSSNSPLDKLACGLAYRNEGKTYRRHAIECFEYYFRNPVPLPKDGERVYFSDWELHSYLSTLYEKEYMFDEAIKQLEYCQMYKNQAPYIKDYVNPADYTRVADIMVKRDGIDRAIEYIESLKNQNIYINIKHAVDFKYNELLEKKKKGYVYRPRKNNKEIYYAK